MSMANTRFSNWAHLRRTRVETEGVLPSTSEGADSWSEGLGQSGPGGSHWVRVRHGLCNIDDVDGFVQAIRELASDQKQLGEMGRRARATVLERFTIRHMAQKYIDLFRSFSLTAHVDSVASESLIASA